MGGWRVGGGWEGLYSRGMPVYNFLRHICRCISNEWKDETAHGAVLNDMLL